MVKDTIHNTKSYHKIAVMDRQEEGSDQIRSPGYHTKVLKEKGGAQRDTSNKRVKI